MNRRGNIPITILVVGVIALFIIALMVFDNKIKDEEKDLELFQILSVINNVKEKMDMGVSLKEIKEEYGSGRSYRGIVRGIEEEEEGLVYRKIESGRILFWRKRKVVFEVKF
jgi:hypothetical protein